MTVIFALGLSLPRGLWVLRLCKSGWMFLLLSFQWMTPLLWFLFLFYFIFTLFLYTTSSLKGSSLELWPAIAHTSTPTSAQPCVWARALNVLVRFAFSPISEWLSYSSSRYMLCDGRDVSRGLLRFSWHSNVSNKAYTHKQALPVLPASLANHFQSPPRSDTTGRYLGAFFFCLSVNKALVGLNSCVTAR